jgi:EmrB/QacA subfamily drug resistance transporter
VTERPRARWVVLAAVLGSGMAMLDATVVNVALPALGKDLDAGIEGLAWTLNGYTLTLASFILLGGSLGDRFGRRRVFVIGTIWFAVASLFCGLAPRVELLIAARALPGVGGALLTPGSLAMIAGLFEGEERGRAIGLWSGLSGRASAIGPFAGGWIIAAVGWRWVFLVNLPVAAAVVWVAQRHVPETKDPEAAKELDLTGAVLGAVGLAGITWALVQAGESGLSVAVALAGAAGAAALACFVLVERRSRHPMLPLGLFASRQFTAANLVTFLVYAALGGVFFALVMHLQIVAGYSPLVAGSALLPVTALLLVLSGPAGAVSERIGPRLPMSLGPMVSAAGLLLMLRIGARPSYLLDVLPAATVFGLGLAITVAPLTSAVLAAAPGRYAGIASGVNNAVARAASLLAVAMLPLVAGLRGEEYRRPDAFAAGFRVAALVCAAMLAGGGLLAALLIRRTPATESARR